MCCENPKYGGLHNFSEGNHAEEQVTSGQKSPSAETIQAWLISRLSEAVGVEPQEIDIREPFTRYGLSSREAVILSGDLEVWLGSRISPTLVWDYPTVEAVARYLAGEASHSESFEASTNQRFGNEETEQLLIEIERLSEEEVIAFEIECAILGDRHLCPLLQDRSDGLVGGAEVSGIESVKELSERVEPALGRGGRCKHGDDCLVDPHVPKIGTGV